MARNKLRKFEEMSCYPNVFQYPLGALHEKGFEMKGRWREMYFGNPAPVVLELGCGKGEYTVGLGKLFPGKNFIGVDIKGARMWSGAKQALEEHLSNVAFLRTRIELLSHFFAPGEVSEIWITFPDPQMKKTNKRMTSTCFLRMYSELLSEGGGVIHLKTDSPFMYAYTREMIRVNRLPTLVETDDLYRSRDADEILSIRTFYEQQWLSRGMSIKYLRFICEPREEYLEPDIVPEPDPYRSFGRNQRPRPACSNHFHDNL
ncbi:MAG: tRNA (guanosine(46)-N7)-methyltransferase TrmB [Tannerella sp.]|jgi:tRNA (guanine-N7-)-methyltransferase|nr:tRNA (guanosine(46)-N7)-methyltransferase TrmB [Tannerella sp.]